MTANRIVGYALMTLVVLAAGTLLFLWRRTGDLERQLQQPTEIPAEKLVQVKLIKTGDRLPEFTGNDLDGNPVRIGPHGEMRIVLFVYNPECELCHEAMAGWNTVIDRLRDGDSATGVYLISVSDRETTKGHAAIEELPLIPVLFPDQELPLSLGITRVPLTLVVDPEGVVRGVWDRPLDGAALRDLMQLACPACPF